MQQLANVATSDAYTVAATLGPLATAQQLVYVVANASAYMQLSPSNQSGTTEDWLPEILVPPSSNVIARVTGARWRSAVAGSPAQIVAQLIQPDDPAPGAGTPFTSTLAASGAVGSGVQIPEVTLAQWPPASPTEQQAVVLILPSSFDPIGGKPVRWLCHYDAANAVWHVMGPALYAEVQTSETTASTTYADLATVGPSITLPRPGDYIVSQGYRASANSGFQVYMAYQGAGIAGASDNDMATHAEGNAGGSNPSVMRLRPKPGLTTASALVAKYKLSGGAGTLGFANRWMAAEPLRIT